MKSTIIVYWMMAVCTSSVFGQRGEVRGKVSDALTRQPLAGVNVSLPQLNTGTITDAGGEYTVRNLPVGLYRIEFSYMGYAARTVTDIMVTSSKISRVDAELSREVVQGEKVVVTAGYFNKPDDSPVSVQKLNYEEIRRAPGARGDVSRMLQSLPGVNPSSDDRNDLVIRGGSPSEVLFRIDGIDIPNPNHFGTQGATGGPISMINTELIDDVSFMAGGFSARYGHKLSGVMDISFREGNRNRFSGLADLNMAGVGGIVEGPLAGKRGSFLISLHRSFLELMEPLLGYGGIPRYTNLQSKFVFDLNSDNQISLLVLGGDDSILIGRDPEADDFREAVTDTLTYTQTDFRSRQLTAGIRLRTFWNARLFSDVTLSRSWYRYYTDLNQQSVAGYLDSGGKMEQQAVTASKDVYDNISTEEMSVLKTDWRWQFSGNHALDFGAYIRVNQFRHDIAYTPFDEGSVNSYGRTGSAASMLYRQKHTPKTGGYINARLQLGPRLRVNAGGRYDYTRLLAEGHFGPRLNAALRVTDRLSFTLGGGRYYQDPEYIHISGNEANVQVLKTIGADHLIAGMEYLPAKDTRLTIEAYRKTYHNYPVMADSAYGMISLANSGAVYGSTGSSRLVSRGSGRVRGVEVMLQKKMTRNIYGLAGYSWSEIRHRALDGVMRPGAFDNRHVCNLVLGYRLSKSWEFSVKWRYAGGTPYTPYDEPASIEAGHGLLDLDNINTSRYAPYHRLDFRIDHRSFYEKWTLISYFSIENIYNRRNQLGAYWDVSGRKVRFTAQTGIFPVGGVMVEF